MRSRYEIEQEFNRRGVLRAKVIHSCVHCHQQPLEHANYKCLFDSTEYEPFGEVRYRALLHESQEAFYEDIFG